MKQLFRATVVAGALSVALSHPGRADVVLSGPDANDGTYSTAALASFAASNSGSAIVDGTDGYNGVTLWGLLGGSTTSSTSTGPGSSTIVTYGGIATTTPSGYDSKNAILRDYLVATSATGAQSVVSLGELNAGTSGFGTTSAYLAYQPSAGGPDLSAPSLIVPGATSRDLSNVVSLQLLSVPALPGPNSIPPNPAPTSIAVSGNTAAAGTYTQTQLNILANQPSSPIASTIGTDTYTGVALSTFLQATSPNPNGEIVIAQGGDGYEIVYALGELLNNNCTGGGCDLLTGESTGSDFTADDPARTILSTDSANKHGRYDSNVSALIVEDAIPEPASLALLASAIAGVVVLRRRGAAKA